MKQLSPSRIIAIGSMVAVMFLLFISLRLVPIVTEEAYEVTTRVVKKVYEGGDKDVFFKLEFEGTTLFDETL